MSHEGHEGSRVLWRFRGLLLSLVALDTARRYLHAPAIAPSPSSPTIESVIWSVTAAAVPLLVFAQGIDVYRRGRSVGAAARSRGLLTGGLALVLLELTLVRAVAWFTLDYTRAIGVLELFWVLGASMLVLAVLVHLPLRDVAIFAVLVIGLHNALDGLEPPGRYGPGTAPGFMGMLWILLHGSGDVFRLVGTSGPVIGLVHPLLPFAGIIAAGYACGVAYEWDGARRARWFRRGGFGLLAAFVVLRATARYGDPAPWSIQDTPVLSMLSFVGATRFPPSALFVTLWLGLALLLMPILEKPGFRTSALAAVGRAPLFAYVAQVFIIHLLAIVITVAAGRDASHLFVGQPFEGRPAEGSGFGLAVVAGCWIAGMVLTLGACVLWYRGSISSRAALERAMHT